MPTFKKTEIFDARQFTGGKQNGSDLSLWIIEHGHYTEARADWHDGIISSTRSIPERIRLRTYTERTDVYVGDWVILRQNGIIEHSRKQDFESAGYEQI